LPPARSFALRALDSAPRLDSPGAPSLKRRPRPRIPPEKIPFSSQTACRGSQLSFSSRKFPSCSQRGITRKRLLLIYRSREGYSGKTEVRLVCCKGSMCFVHSLTRRSARTRVGDTAARTSMSAPCKIFPPHFTGTIRLRIGRNSTRDKKATGAYFFRHTRSILCSRGTNISTTGQRLRNCSFGFSSSASECALVFPRLEPR
jgi:hypothetical protein